MYRSDRYRQPAARSPTRTPVILVELEAVAPFLPEELVSMPKVGMVLGMAFPFEGVVDPGPVCSLSVERQVTEG